MELIAITESGELAKPAPSRPQVAAEVVEATTQLYRAVGYEPPWIGYLAIENGEKSVKANSLHVGSVERIETVVNYPQDQEQ